MASSSARALGWRLVPALVLLAAVFAGCTPHLGDDPGPRASPPSGRSSALCRQVDSARGLVLHRHVPAANTPRFTFPARTTGKDPAKVQAVARTLCSLPPMPRALHCPLDRGPLYRLVVSTATRHVVPVTFDATGCETVHGLGPPRWAARSGRFWSSLGAAIGLAHAGQGTFAGTLPG